jgi:hypothetical protein
MLLTATPTVPADTGWALEVKWDGGARAAALRRPPGHHAVAAGSELQPVSGAARYRQHAGRAARIGRRARLLDADGLPDFERLRARTPGTVAHARANARSAPAGVLSNAGFSERSEPDSNPRLKRGLPLDWSHAPPPIRGRWSLSVASVSPLVQRQGDLGQLVVVGDGGEQERGLVPVGASEPVAAARAILSGREVQTFRLETEPACQRTMVRSNRERSAR